MQTNKQEYLAAVKAGSALSSKEALRWPEEVCMYLGLDQPAAEKFLAVHEISRQCYMKSVSAQAAKFVLRKKLDSALKSCPDWPLPAA